jgi:hypothetical protein
MLCVMDFHHRDSRAVTIRPASWADAERLELLAELDEDEVPPAPLLLGLVGDEFWAAISLETGDVIADPFRPSAEVVTLLAARGRQLSGPAQRRFGLRARRAGRAAAQAVGLALKTT